jgi:hypothetical protein
MASDAFDWSDRSPSAECRVCGGESVKGGYLCKRCRRFEKRVGNRAGFGKVGRAARLEALWNAWNPRAGAFVCAYTGVALSDDPSSRRFARWELGADGSSVELASDQVARMKADLTPVEFRRFVRALARHYDGKPFDKRAFPPDAEQAA